MSLLNTKGKTLCISLLIGINAYGLTNLATEGTYCQHFRLNSSSSLPFYIFSTSSLKMVERNMYVSLTHPFSSQELLKQIVGLPGDLITIRDQHVWVNDKDYGFIYSTSPSGLALSPLPEGIIPQGFFFVHATHPQSFDSRYAEFGLVSKEQLKERLCPLF
ncbi:conjugative transfer signal peptidase TraF [Candidatus Protochlamydia amoebophila]|uniref:Peptidase S26 domain-containing protein n=1 Tax=Protochlamydia amoebophila (strain UWE25) TaxID=264201 RepID=Q6MB94_PARUW|nr:conjugative transfer signal peptidase TraF [Candidatus Protochlamydia amoebophila]CAF24155.1 unnamed protein product [Candidatus Protochlamydia amoebophila UWE25]